MPMFGIPLLDPSTFRADVEYVSNAQPVNVDTSPAANTVRVSVVSTIAAISAPYTFTGIVHKPLTSSKIKFSLVPPQYGNHD